MKKTTSNWISTKELVDNYPKGWEEGVSGGEKGTVYYTDKYGEGGKLIGRVETVRKEDEFTITTRTTKKQGDEFFINSNKHDYYYTVIEKGEGWYYKEQIDFYREVRDFNYKDNDFSKKELDCIHSSVSKELFKEGLTKEYKEELQLLLDKVKRFSLIEGRYELGSVDKYKE